MIVRRTQTTEETRQYPQEVDSVLGTRYSVLSSQLPQNLFPQLLRLAEELLILDEQPIQL